MIADKNTTLPQIVQDVLWNISAVSAEVHKHPGYELAYKRCAEENEGFVGIWLEMVKAGQVLSFTESTDDGHYDWVDLIDSFAGLIIVDFISKGSCNYDERAEEAYELAQNKSAEEGS